jgi:hypothetical protein
LKCHHAVCDHRHMSAFATWFERVTNGASHRAAAAAVDMSNATVSRWFKIDQPPADGVVALARAYGADPIEALIAIGILEPEEYPRTVREVNSYELLQELMRRELVIEDVRPVPPRKRKGGDSDVG